MSVKANNVLYRRLRQDFPHFVYEDFSTSIDDSGLSIRYHFNLADRYVFHPELFIPRKPFFRYNINESELKNLAFQIGMIELISYWKAACSPQVIIRPAGLSRKQVAWWKNLYFHGLGEFFHTNGIAADESDFMLIRPVNKINFNPVGYDAGDQVLVPVGGGKDSAVTLELLQQHGMKMIPFIINPRRASLDTARVAGFSRDEVFEVSRSIDPELLRLNEQGFLNGHTPFSAVVAFNTVLAARLTNSRHIALSNESSANEATIPGTNINHQYSKSWAFEADFRTYCAKYITPDANYFSLLRPLNELQIARLFARAPKYFNDFKSCNAGSKTDTWCGRCPKCLFTWIMLNPFVETETLERIFGKNLLDDPSLIPLLNELTGRTDEKPFECVGTIDEVNAAMKFLLQKSGPNPPALLQHYASGSNTSEAGNFEELLHAFNPQHFLTTEFENLIRKARS